MDSDIRERLRRLGVRKGAGHLTPKRPLKPSGLPPVDLPAEPRPFRASGAIIDAAPIERVDRAHASPPLTIAVTPYGEAAYRRTRFPLAYNHGDRALFQTIQQPSQHVARLAGRAIPEFDVSRAVFVDTETTGLAGGAGTFAFLVGVGWFDAGHFVVDQFFLRDPAEEAAMLREVEGRLADRSGLVTFNGRTFDIPLLETRYILSRLVPPFDAHAHLDLLMPSRRAWRNMLSSCSLGSLEYHLLGVRRDQQDIAGFLIPQLYREYLNSGLRELNAEMDRVMYHNLLDIVSMVTLIPRLCDAFQRPSAQSERLAVAAQAESDSDWAAAEAMYLQAVEQSSGDAKPVLKRLTRNLKKQGKTDQAVEHWVRLADSGELDAQIELAKHYEWRDKDLPNALRWAKVARAGAADPQTRRDIDRRIVRLQRKVEKS